MMNLKVIKSLRTKLKKMVGNRNGFGMNEVLGIAAALIIAAFIVIPQLRGFATTVTARLSTWWTTISTTIFPAT